MRSILVTGGAGFIGSHIAELHQGRAKVRILDNLRSGRRENLKGIGCELVEGDILDRDLLRRCLEGVDTVFHLAAMVSVPESMERPSECLKVNSIGTAIVLEEAVKAGVRKLVLSSTSAIYGDDPEQPKRESMRPCPISPYGLSKLDGEALCEIFSRQGRIKTACLRYFNVFGPRQNPQSAYAAAIPIFVSKALKGEDIPIYGDGTQTRDFVYVKEIAAANAFAAESELQGVCNVGYGRTAEVGAIASEIVRITKSKSRIVNLPERPGDIKHSGASVEKLLAAGYKVSTDFKSGLDATIRFFMGA